MPSVLRISPDMLLFVIMAALPDTEDDLAEKRRWDRFVLDMKLSFNEQIIEHGCDHPSEDLISEALETFEEQQVLDLLRMVILDPDDCHLASSVLMSLQNLPPIGSPRWRYDLIDDALWSKDLSIRDDAATLAYKWGTQEMSTVLRMRQTVETVGYLATTWA